MDPFDLEGQAASREAQKRRDEFWREVEAKDIEWLMSGPRGRRIVFRIIARSGKWSSAFTGNSETFYRIGMSEVGRWLENMLLDKCPEQYVEMIKEAKANERAAGNDKRIDEHGTT